MTLSDKEQWSPVCGYQGGKRKFADEIAAALIATGATRFYDIGVGSGAVSLALVRKGVAPSAVTAIDAGPWGDYWHSIGSGMFPIGDADRLLAIAEKTEPERLKSWIESVVAPAPPTPATFIVLQAASFGASAVFHNGAEWRQDKGVRRYNARALWTPPPGSARTAAVPTMYNIPVMRQKLAHHVARMRGLDAWRQRAEDTFIRHDAAVYIDPPFAGVGGYSSTMAWEPMVSAARWVFVSEARPIDGCTRHVELGRRKLGTFKGASRLVNQEFLSHWENW